MMPDLHTESKTYAIIMKLNAYTENLKGFHTINSLGSTIITGLDLFMLFLQ